jgi:hypothetical protein
MDYKNKIMKNSFIINYTNRVLVINFNEASFEFELWDGDKTSYYETFISSDKKLWTVDFYQLDESEQPTVFVYSNNSNEKDIDEIRRRSDKQIKLELIKKIGDAEQYFYTND